MGDSSEQPSHSLLKKFFQCCPRVLKAVMIRAQLCIGVQCSDTQGGSGKDNASHIYSLFRHQHNEYKLKKFKC